MWVNKALVGIVLALGLPSAAHALDGAKLYKNNCETCHQSDGWGIPFMAAPLVESNIVDGDAEYLAWLVMTGTGNIKDWQSDFSTPMPGFKQLSDDELASVLSFVRSEFGSIKNEVSIDDVMAARMRGN